MSINMAHVAILLAFHMPEWADTTKIKPLT